MSAAKNTGQVSISKIPTVHIQEVNGVEFVFDVLPLAEAMHVHVPCVLVACTYVPGSEGVAPVDHYLSHTTHLARTLADPHLLACLNTHHVTHVRIWREARATRRKKMADAMPQCRGVCNLQLQRASR